MKSLRDYAEYRGFKIAGEYCDAGKSGMNTRNRPEFRKMMDDVKLQKDDVEYVLVFKLSRFGRNSADILRSMQVLNDFGVNLVSVSESIDSSTQGGRLTLAILSAVAEMEHENILVQFIAGRMQKIKNGDWSGGTVPYGYMNIDHNLVIDDYEAEIIRKIFELYCQEGSTATSVAKLMNDSSYERKDTKGTIKPFTYEFVSRVIDNPFYYGLLSFGRRSNKKDKDGHLIKYDAEHVVEVLGNHEAIVSKDLWDTAHQKRENLAGRYKKVKENIHVLSGIVRCPVCGKNLVGTVSRTKKEKGEGYYKSISYYQCRLNSPQNARICSFSKKLNQEIIDGLVFQIIGRLQYYDEFRNALESSLGTADSVEMKEQQLRQLRVELRDAEFNKDKLGIQLDGLNPLNKDYDKKYDQLSDRLDATYDIIDELESKIKKTKKALETMKERHESFGNITDFLTNINQLVEKMSDKEKKELCNAFIEHIDVFEKDQDDGKIIKSISFKFPLGFDGKELISNKDDSDLITFTLDCENIKIELSEKGDIVMKTMADGTKKVIVRKPTYAAIKSYIKEKYGACVSTLNIAQTKRKYGVAIGEAYNKPKNPKSRVPNCTPQKEKMILDAFKHFDLVNESTEYKEGE